MKTDLGFLFESVINFFVKILDITFYVWGVEINVGAMFLFALCAGLVLWFLQKMGD